MKVRIKKVNPTRRKATVKVRGEDVALKLEKWVKSYSKHARLKGFRKGKAPRHLIFERYHKELKEHLKESLTSDLYKKVKESESLNVCAVVNVEGLETLEDSLEKLKDLELVYTVDVRPDFTLPPYESFELELPPAEPTDEEIRKLKEFHLNEHAHYAVAERPAQQGDYVKLSYQGFISEKPVVLAHPHAIYGTQSQTWEHAGNLESPGVPAIVKGIVGMQAGQKSEMEENFPKDNPIQELAGKKVVYHVEVHAVHSKQLPTVDEAFAKKAGADSVEQWETNLKENLTTQKKHYVEDMKKNGLLNELLEQTRNMPLPESLVEREKTAMLKQLHAQAKHHGNNDDPKKLEKKATAMAERRVRSDFLMTAIAEKEKIELEQKDLQKALLKETSYLQISPDELVKRLKNKPEAVAALRHQALFEKTLDFLAERVKAKAT